MTEFIEARVEHRFETATAEEVFDAWLDEEDVRAWMASALRSHGLAGDIQRVEIDPWVGGRFFFSDVRDGEEAEHWGTYQALERPRLIEFTWFTSKEEEETSTSLVRIEITAEVHGCSVVLTHKLDAAFADYLDQTRTGWRTMLAAVERTNDGTDRN